MITCGIMLAIAGLSQMLETVANIKTSSYIGRPKEKDKLFSDETMRGVRRMDVLCSLSQITKSFSLVGAGVAVLV